MTLSGTKLVVSIVICTSVGIGIGVLIGYYSNNSSSPGEQQSVEEDEGISAKLMNEMNSDNIKTHLR